MQQIKHLLDLRKQNLLKIKKEKENALLRAPEGHLRVCCHKGRTQYYHRKDPSDFSGEYIRSEDSLLAKALAQKTYDANVLTSTNKELKAIDKYLNLYPKLAAEEIYPALHPERQNLIVPVKKTDEQYIQEWISVPYEGKGFKEDSVEFYTQRGERVRSKSEIIIADMLYRNQIPYRYEYPLYLKGYGTVYPDFDILHVKKRTTIKWEHFGMMDEPFYAEKAIQKIATLEQHGFYSGENLILTFETKKSPLNQKIIKAKIDRYLK